MDLPKGNSFYLEPGFIYFSKRPSTVRTVVGSCVAICLWDKKLRCGGMNHFIHPFTQEQENATPQYGNVAIAALVRIMEEAGCKRENMVAHVLGGAAPLGVFGDHVGRQNVSVAKEMLIRKGILIVGEDVGGHIGRKIAFDTATGQLAVLKVHQLRAEDWRV